MQKLIAKRFLNDNQAEALKAKFLDDTAYDVVITKDTDCYDANGLLLFKFRKNVIPLEILKQGYEAFKGSIQHTDGRGTASGGNHKRVRKDGSVSNISISNKVYSGNVGFMDAGAMVHYCRKTAFARQYFDKFKEGVPFVKFVDAKYKELCPEHYAKQINISNGTNRNYVIDDTSFTTVTVNRNFQTAVHKDSGDLPEGFGNLCVYREGHFEGSYFCLPEYRIAIDMQNTDLLFVDVHRWHGNTPFKACSEDFMRIAFVMYFREYMYLCKQPSEELHNIKMKETGYLKL
jgi:2-oxoglutarate-Fe(II)-dependent dioxygenase family protein